MTAAFELAMEWHEGQKYGTEEYIEHLRCVNQKTAFLWESGTDEDSLLSSLAWCHDILKDTDITIEEIRKALKGALSGPDIDRLVEALLAITKTDDITREEYIDRCCANSLAHKVKLADTLSNLECSVKSGNERLIFKYTKQINRLYAWKQE